MKRIRNLIAVLACFLAPVAFGQAVPTNLVVNPSFEEGSLGWTFSVDPSLGVDVGTCAQPCVVPRTGSNAAYKNLAGGGMGTIRQTIPTIPGHTYLVDVGLAINGTAIGTVSASFGATVGVLVTANDLSTSYSVFSFTHVATSTSTEFVFGGLVTGGTFFMDDVSVVDTNVSLAQCEDGLDNDLDGLVDFPNDPGCSSTADNDETDIPVLAQCQDGVDNDLDGLIDFPNDPGCSSPADNDETDIPVLAQCQDGVDNDLDGLIDHLNDPGCISGTDNTESTDNLNLVVNPSFEQGTLGWAFSSSDAGTCAQPCVFPSMGSNAAYKNFTGSGAGTIRQSIPTIPGNTYFVEVGFAINGSGIGSITASFGSTVGVSITEVDTGTSYTFFSFHHVATSTSTEFVFGGLVTGGTFFMDDVSVVDTNVSLAQCEDGFDNDLDGLIDFPSDPGCSSAADNDETDIPVPAQCEDGFDNDLDGLVDFPNDPGCSSAADNDETDIPALAQCEDLVDNDLDGLIDFPNDPGCSSPADNDETDIPVLAQCQDGVDNDLDGLIDHLNDPGCISGTDNTESTDNLNLVVNPSFEQGTLGWAFSSSDAGTCAQPCVFPSMGSNAAYKNFTGSGAGTIRQSIPTIPGNTYFVEVGFAINGSGIGSITASFGSTVGVSITEVDTGTSYTFFSFHHVATSTSTEFVFGGLVTGGTFFMDDVAVVNTSASLAQCEDGIDNDLDGLIDFPSDPGCFSLADDDEFNPLAQCADGIDNDGDGLTDFPADPGCVDAADDDEFNPLAQCADGIDNDGDGLTDFPADPGCVDAADDDEFNPLAQCADGIDNDGDGLTDFPADPGCVDAADDDEFNPLAQCADGIDNDLDGLIDFPADPGCVDAADDDEFNPLAQCADGIDNDLDGLIDFPLDPGCSDSSDNNEFNVLPECSDGVDNDGDGLTDFPADPGCNSSADNDEFQLLPQCADGIDNDGDGLIDFPADPGCDNALEDNDEIDQPLVDLDIHSFRVGGPLIRKPACFHRLYKNPRNTKISLTVKNNGMVNGPRLATVIGLRSNGFGQPRTEVYSETILISSPVGGKATKWIFPEYAANDNASIRWEATVADDDPDNDVSILFTGTIGSPCI